MNPTVVATIAAANERIVIPLLYWIGSGRVELLDAKGSVEDEDQACMDADRFRGGDLDFGCTRLGAVAQLSEQKDSADTSQTARRTYRRQRREEPTGNQTYPASGWEPPSTCSTLRRT